MQWQTLGLKFKSKSTWECINSCKELESCPGTTCRASVFFFPSSLNRSVLRTHSLCQKTTIFPKMKDSPDLDQKSRIKEWIFHWLLFGIHTATQYRYSNYWQCHWSKKVNFPNTSWSFFRTGPGVCILIFEQTVVQCIDFGELVVILTMQVHFVFSQSDMCFRGEKNWSELTWKWATTVNISKKLKLLGFERLTDFIFMKPSYDSSRDEVDQPAETESKRSSAIMDQNTSSLKSNKVMIICIFRNMKSRDIALWNDQFIGSCISGHENLTIKVKVRVKFDSFQLANIC